MIDQGSGGLGSLVGGVENALGSNNNNNSGSGFVCWITHDLVMICTDRSIIQSSGGLGNVAGKVENVLSDFGCELCQFLCC